MFIDKSLIIFKNTLFLYLRQILILLINLYSVRVVINELGLIDYGVYNSIISFVLLSSFIYLSLEQATKRFFSSVIGDKNNEKLKKIFSVNILLYISIAIFIFIFFRVFGDLVVKYFLLIPEDRYFSAIKLFNFLTLFLVINVVLSPFIAMILSYEDMKAYALISLVETFFLLVVLILLQNIDHDKLELYGLLLLVHQIIRLILYVSFCSKNYKACQIKKIYWDKELFREILSFTGWTIYGQLSTVFRTHAITILLNQNFNPLVVAARSIALQIAIRVGVFSENFNLSLYPSIIKTYASNQKIEMFKLIVFGSKITFFLLWIFAFPLIIEMQAILDLWLNTYPQDAVLFSQLSLVEVLIFSLSMPIAIAARAPGKMKNYELILGTIQILIFFISLLIIYLGSQAYGVFIVAIIANILMLFIRIFLVEKLTGLPAKSFISQSLLPVCKIISITSIPIITLNFFLPDEYIFSILLIIVSLIISSLAMYYYGLDQEWKNYLKNYILKLYRR